MVTKEEVLIISPLVYRIESLQWFFNARNDLEPKKMRNPIGISLPHGKTWGEYSVTLL
jgi:hypothetical protein